MSGYPYTDYLGNPIHAGDFIVYPTASGSSAANLHLAVVDEIVPITPDDPRDPACRRGWIAGDHDSRSRTIPGKWVTRPDLQKGYGDFLRDDSKAYQLRVKRLRDGASGREVTDKDRIVRIKNVDRVVVVSNIYCETA